MAWTWAVIFTVAALLWAGPAWADCPAAKALAAASIRTFETDQAMGLGGLRQAHLACPESEEITYNLGLALYRAGQPNEAYETWSTLARRRPSNLKLLLNLGRLALNLERLPEAEAWARQAAGSAPADERVLALQMAVGAAQIKRRQALKLDLAGLKSTLPPGPLAFGLVVGIRDYEHLNGPAFADRDARQMSALLTRLGGFDPARIRERLNRQATVGRLYDDLAWLSEQGRLNPSAKIFFYFSGHGAPLLAPDGQTIQDGLLVPAEASLGRLSDRTALSLNFLKEQLAGLPNQEVVAVVDACFSGAGKSVMDKRPALLKVAPGLLNAQKPFISAAAADRPAEEYPDGEQGAFTYFFLKALMGQGDADQDGWVDAVEAFEYACKNLSALGKEQNPQMSPAKRIRLARVR